MLLQVSHMSWFMFKLIDGAKHSPPALGSFGAPVVTWQLSLNTYQIYPLDRTKSMTVPHTFIPVLSKLEHALGKGFCPTGCLGVEFLHEVF